MVFGVLACASFLTVFIQSRWGLRASYFKNPGWRGDPALVRIESNPYLKGNTRENILSAAVFSVKWAGWIAIPETGKYRFSTNSDDGSTIQLDEKLIVDNSGMHGLQRKSQEIELDAGIYHLKIHYFQAGGYSTLKVRWTPPGDRESFIPPAFFFAEKPSEFDVKFRSAILHGKTLLWFGWGIFGLSLLGALWKNLRREHSFSSVLRGYTAVAFFLFLSLFSLQSFWKFFPESSLNGIVVNAPSPHLSLKGWFSGEFQQAAETWFKQYFGFRSFWVRTYNQIHFSLFRQMPSKSSGTTVVLGENNWLYAQSYLREHAGNSVKPPLEELEQRVQDLRRLQEELERHGKAFLLIISPSKASIYPEYMPRSYRVQSKDRTYYLLTPLLDKYGIRYLDAYQVLSKAKSTSPYRLFPQGGIHWNDYGAFLIFRESIEELNRQLTEPLPIPTFDRVDMAPPRGSDRDLIELLNVWTPQAINTPCPYLNFTTTPLPPEKQPGVLMVGDSFTWHLADFFSEQQICTGVEILFYYNSLIRYPRKDNFPFDPKNTDWNQLLLAKKIVILELNQVQLHREIGFGFVGDALRVLGGTQSSLE